MVHNIERSNLKRINQLFDRKSDTYSIFEEEIDIKVYFKLKPISKPIVKFGLDVNELL